MSNALVLTPLNGEPRIHDLLLAQRLGFERPTDIRKIIKRNEKNLNKFNHIAIVPRSVELGNGAKREVSEYWLNQKQAAFICLKSETDNAFDVQVEIIRVFDAYLTGDLVPAKKQQAELGLHTKRDIQLKHSKDINSVMMERGGVQAIIQYNTKNCVIQSGKHPAELKRKAKDEGLPSRQRQSAKEYLRANNPPVACGMSLADRLVSCGADADAGIAIGKNAQPIFEQIMALGFTPAELDWSFTVIDFISVHPRFINPTNSRFIVTPPTHRQEALPLHALEFGHPLPYCFRKICSAGFTRYSESCSRNQQP